MLRLFAHRLVKRMRQICCFRQEPIVMLKLEY